MTENSLRVLVVDDDTMARMMAAQCVKQQGHTAIMASGGKQALEQLQSDEFDLVLLDLMMPDVDGFEVLTKIMSDPRLKDIPVIIVTGTEEAGSVKTCIEMGAASHLKKPLDPELMAIQIDRLSNDSAE
jgi:adenylate cyclase